MSETTKGLLLARSHMTICVSCGAIGFPRQSAPARVLPGLPCTDRRSRAAARTRRTGSRHPTASTPSLRETDVLPSRWGAYSW